MNIEQVSMNQTDALKAFREYRAAVRERYNKEDYEIMQANSTEWN